MCFQSSYRQFPFYEALNIVTVLPHCYCLMLFSRYQMRDGNLNRACLPIASLVMLVTTSLIIFQICFIQLKDLGTF